MPANASMIPSTPLRPAPSPVGEPQESRRGTMILNVALVAVAAVVILSNLLFFPLGSRDARRAAERAPPPAPPAASAPVLVELPAPPSRPAEPPAPPESPKADARAGTVDAGGLPRIEPAAPPSAPEPVTGNTETAGASAQPAPEAPPQIVASLPPAADFVPQMPAVSSPPPETSVAAVESPALSSDEIEALTRRGDALLATGDIVAARYAYERAAAAGSATAATGVGKTFDPLFLASAGVHGIQGNAFEAAAWYRKGRAAGDSEAATRLRALRQQFPE